MNKVYLVATEVTYNLREHNKFTKKQKLQQKRVGMQYIYAASDEDAMQKYSELYPHYTTKKVRHFTNNLLPCYFNILKYTIVPIEAKKATMKDLFDEMNYKDFAAYYKDYLYYKKQEKC